MNVRERNYILVNHELQYIVYNLVTFEAARQKTHTTPYGGIMLDINKNLL